MEDRDVRELVRIRFELRQLMTKGGQPEAAAPLIDRMQALAAREPAGGGVGGEAGRWSSLFRLEAAPKLAPKI